MSFLINKCKSALILGSGDIAQALASELLNRSPLCRILLTKSPRKKLNMDLQNTEVFEHNPKEESSWKKLAFKVRESDKKLDLIISTYGVLHKENMRPEKSLKEISFEVLQESFLVNSFSAPMAGKYLGSSLSKESPTVMCFLSAKVGSIGDNKIGGWYSYRASKASLNMFSRNMAIEFKRKGKKTCVLAIHPGTTKTKLSEPYLKNFNLKVWEPSQTAKHILNVIEGKSVKETGSFYNWDGSELPW